MCTVKHKYTHTRDLPRITLHFKQSVINVLSISIFGIVILNLSRKTQFIPCKQANNKDWKKVLEPSVATNPQGFTNCAQPLFCRARFRYCWCYRCHSWSPGKVSDHRADDKWDSMYMEIKKGKEQGLLHTKSYRHTVYTNRLGRFKENIM